MEATQSIDTVALASDMTPYILFICGIFIALVSWIWKSTQSMIKGLKKNQDALIKMVDRHELLHEFQEKRLDKLEGAN